MKNRVKGLAAIAGSVLLCFALPAFAVTDATVDFTGVVNTHTFGGVYSDPYAGTVKENGTTINDGGVIVCDDYYDRIYTNETWTATALQASTLTTANIDNTMFGKTIGIDGYAAVASLVTDMLATTDQTTQDDITSAIWWLTSGGTVSKGVYKLNGYTLDADADNYIAAALAAYGALGGDTTAAQSALAKDTNLTILTPITGDYPIQDGMPQEMFIVTPEGGAALIYLMLAGATCFGAVFFRSPNRLRNCASA